MKINVNCQNRLPCIKIIKYKYNIIMFAPLANLPIGNSIVFAPLALLCFTMASLTLEGSIN